MKSKTQKYSLEQASADLDVLLNTPVKKAFRVTGSILRIYFVDSNVENATILVSYADWEVTKGNKVLADTFEHWKEEMDDAIEQFSNESPILQSYRFDETGIELTFSNELSIHFKATEKFPALAIHNPKSKNNVDIWNEKKIFYEREV